MAALIVLCLGDNGGDAKRTDISSTCLLTVSCSRHIFCALTAVKYKPVAKKVVANPKTPAAENKPCGMVRQLGFGVDQFLRWPDSTLTPISSSISPTANEILCDMCNVYNQMDERGVKEPESYEFELLQE